jgi:hypothetical protein
MGIRIGKRVPLKGSSSRAVIVSPLAQINSSIGASFAMVATADAMIVPRSFVVLKSSESCWKQTVAFFPHDQVIN